MPCYQRIRVSIERGEPRSDGLKEYQEQYVPCGQCLGCRSEQARQWAVRMVHESTQHDHAYFVTLTYDDGSLPENGSLNAADIGPFVRRLRRYYKDFQRRFYYKERYGVWAPGYPRGLSYYICGEYGPKTVRPHYHAVLYGPGFPDRTVLRGDGRAVVWKSEVLDQLWSHGITEFSALTFGSASYVAQYVRKKVGARSDPDRYLRVQEQTGELVEVAPEFARMSRRPAIGRRWIEKYWRDVYPRDYVVVDGFECRPPRYYDRWLEEHHQEVWKEVRRKRWEVDQMEERLDKIHARLDGRERYKESAGRKRAESRLRLLERRERV